MIVVTVVFAGHGVERMDHAGFEIRDEERAMPLVIGNVAQRRAGVFASVEFHVGEFLGQKAGFLAHNEDAAGAGIGAPHALHPFGLARRLAGAVEAKGGGGGEIDVGRFIALARSKRDAEDLPHFASADKQALRFVQPMLARRWLAGTADIKDRSAGAVDVDTFDRQALIVWLVDRMREARDDSLTWLQRIDLHFLL